MQFLTQFLKNNTFLLPKMLFKPKVFCISIQRTGTTSVGNFMEDHGMKVARWRHSNSNKWSHRWMIGDFENIFNSYQFITRQGFEDDPWWFPGFYKVLYHRFPDSKFILFTRDPDKWYDSMVRHSNHKTLGNTYRHCQVYRRLDEYYEYFDRHPEVADSDSKIDNLLLMDEKREHYTMIYNEYNKEAINFFKKYAPQNFYFGRLEDPEKWIKLGRFLNIDVDENYSVHANNSKL